MSEKEFNFKALERQLREIINVSESTEQREAAEKALHMLPKYKRIDEAIEQLRKSLYEANDWSIKIENTGLEEIPCSPGFYRQYMNTGRKTITIEVK